MQSQLSKAAKYYVEESHQLAAWNFLEGHISDEILDEFFEIYCAGSDVLDQVDEAYKENLCALKQ